MIHCIIPYIDNNSQFYADGYVMYRDILHASIPSHPDKSSIKDIDDSLYWDHTLMNYRHSLPMGISRTKIYYTHQPILTHILLIKVVNDSASDTSCWWKQRKSGTMIAIDYHNSCETPTTFKHNFRSVHSKSKKFKKWRSLSTRKTSTPKTDET